MQRRNEVKKIELQQHLKVYNKLGWKVIPLRLVEKDGTKYPVFPTSSWKELVEQLYSHDDPFSALWEFVEQGYTDLALVLDNSGIAVVDVDNPAEFKQEFGVSPEEFALQNNIPLVVSGKGVHLYFQTPSVPVQYKQSWGEVKTTGLMFIPPSEHPVARKPYQWYYPLDLLIINGLPQMPPELLSKIKSRNGAGVTTGQPTVTFEPTTIQRKKQVDTQRLLELLTPYYIVGQRDLLWVGLSGLMRRVGLSLQQAEELCYIITSYFSDDEAPHRLKVLRRTYSLHPSQIASTTWLTEQLKIPQEVVRELKHALGFQPFLNITAENLDIVVSKDAVEQFVLTTLSTTVVRSPSGGVYIFNPEKGIWEFNHRKEGLKELIIQAVLTWVEEMTSAAFQTVNDLNLRVKILKRLAGFKRYGFYLDILYTILPQLPTELPCQIPDSLTYCPEHGKVLGSLQTVVATKNVVVMPYLCGCVQLISKENIPSIREWGITTYCPVFVDTSVESHPLLESYFSVWEDPDLVDTLLRISAYTIFNKFNPLQKVFAFVGRGGSGKTTFSYLIAHLVSDYVIVSGNELLNKSSWANTKAVAASRKLCVIEELPPKVHMGSLVKELTNKKVAGRFLYHDFSDFTNFCTFWLVSNHIDFITDADEAVTRRLELVHFTKRISFKMDEAYKKLLDIPDDVQDKSIPQAEQLVLSNEEAKTALFTRLLKAWTTVCKEGVFVTHSPSKQLKLEITVKYASVSLFVQQHTESRFFYPVKWLYEIYCLWMKSKNLQPVAAKTFQEQISRLCGHKQQLRVHQLNSQLVENTRRVLPEIDTNTNRFMCYLINPTLDFLMSLTTPPDDDPTGGKVDTLSIFDLEDVDDEQEETPTTTTEQQPTVPVCHQCRRPLKPSDSDAGVFECTFHGNRAKFLQGVGWVYLTFKEDCPKQCPLCGKELQDWECSYCGLMVDKQTHTSQVEDEDDDLDFPF